MDVLTKYGAIADRGSGSSSTSTGGSSRPPGVSSGIDMALRLVELLVDRTAAEAAQLMIEYDPQPPFDAGALDKAGADVIHRIIEYAALEVLSIRVFGRPSVGCGRARTTLGCAETLGWDGSDGGGAERVAAGLAGLGGDRDVVARAVQRAEHPAHHARGRRRRSPGGRWRPCRTGSGR